MIIHSITDNIKKQIGNLFFWLLIFVILFDPTGTILHKKDLMFVLVVAFNILFYKPDWSKLPWILLLFCAITIPYLISCMRMTLVDETEAQTNEVIEESPTTGLSVLSSDGVTSVTSVNSYSQANLELNNALCIILIAVAVLIFLLAIAIFIRLGRS